MEIEFDGKTWVLDSEEDGPYSDAYTMTMEAVTGHIKALEEGQAELSNTNGTKALATT